MTGLRPERPLGPSRLQTELSHFGNHVALLAFPFRSSPLPKREVENALYLPEASNTTSITPHVAGVGADTTDGRVSAIAPDALLGRNLYCFQVPRYPQEQPHS